MELKLVRDVNQTPISDIHNHCLITGGWLDVKKKQVIYAEVIR